MKVPSASSPNGIRNKTIMSLMLNCGLGVSEIVNLNPRDLNLAKEILRIVNGKGRKDRDLAMPEYAQDLLKRWRSVRPKSEYFFSTLKSGQLFCRYIGAFIVRYSKKVKIDKKISPHTLRHSYTTEFYRRPKDIETSSKILGYADISNTTIYITIANIEVEKSMKAFNGFNT